MSILTPRRALAMAILASFSLQVFAAEKVSRAEDREEVAVTIYNDSLALIKEVRRIPFDRGANSIALRDVSAKMRPETASLRALSGGSLRLIEQNPGVAVHWIVFSGHADRAREAEASAARFLAGVADPFANPVGHTVRDGLGRLYDRLIAEAPAAELSADDVLLLGRETYDSFAGAWPDREAAGGDDAGFAKQLGDVRKVVASRGPLAQLPPDH